MRLKAKIFYLCQILEVKPYEEFMLKDVCRRFVQDETGRARIFMFTEYAMCERSEKPKDESFYERYFPASAEFCYGLILGTLELVKLKEDPNKGGSWE